MENDYDRSEDDAWHGRIAAGRILSVLAAERLRAPRARTLWGTPAGARGSRSRGVAWDGRWDQKRETRSYVCQRRTQIREYQAKREVRKVTVPAGPHPLHGPPARGPAGGGCKPATTSVAAVTCGVVTGRTARGAETGARGRNRHACSPDRASTPFGTLVALEHRGLSVVLGGTFRLHISAGQLSPARRVATIFS